MSDLVQVLVKVVAETARRNLRNNWGVELTEAQSIDHAAHIVMALQNEARKRHASKRAK